MVFVDRLPFGCPRLPNHCVSSWPRRLIPVMRGRSQWFWIAGLLILGLVAGGLGALLLVPRAPPPQTAVEPPPPGPAPVTAPASLDIPLQTASIAGIGARRATTPALFRLDVDPAVLVLDFPDLHAQALMLNRIAALIEKAGMPRDRIVSEAELDAHIRAGGGDPDQYYYGHDYRAADLARFFRLADSQAMPLNPYETWLRGLLEREGWLQDGAVGALISIPGVSANIDAASRTTILRHELSHAVYFTDPAYVSLTRHLWNGLLTDGERAAIRKFLGDDGYDTNDEDLMANEGQAYLIHTRDPRYFMPAMIGMSPTREAVLRSDFIEDIPEAWLRDSALAVAPVTLAEEPQASPAAKPRAAQTMQPQTTQTVQPPVPPTVQPQAIPTVKPPVPSAWAPPVNAATSSTPEHPLRDVHPGGEAGRSPHSGPP
jgi:hypothetical protein